MFIHIALIAVLRVNVKTPGKTQTVFGSISMQ
jgi:hypothetical protein